MTLFHHTRHENGNSDEINVAGLSGELADQQKPKAHKSTHQKGGTDDLESLLKLSQLLEKAHGSLTGIGASDHHSKTTASEINLNDLAEKNHGSLANVTPSQHHSKTSKLSEITSIDTDKDWNGKNITNLGSKAHNLNDQLVKGITFNLGLATVGTKQAQALIPGTFTISKVITYADNAPVGADLKINIKINGASLWDDADRLIIANGANSGSNSDLDHTALAEGNRLTIDVDQVGSTTPGGNDLLVTIIC